MTAGAATRIGRVGGAALPSCLAALVLAGGEACKKSAPPPSLGEPLSVEQPGGRATELIERGSEIPTSATETFTTLRDGDRRMAVHVLRGAGRSAQKLRDEGWWVIDGVSGGHAGQPRVLVTFELDGQGALSVSAREGNQRLRVAKADESERAMLVPAPLSEPDEDEDSGDDDEK